MLWIGVRCCVPFRHNKFGIMQTTDLYQPFVQTNMKSQHVWQYKGHFPHLASGKIMHLSNWIHYNSTYYVRCAKTFPLVQPFYVTKGGMWRGQCSTSVCLDRVGKRHGSSCYTNNRRTRPVLRCERRCHAPCGLRTLKRPSRIWRDPDVSSWFRHYFHVGPPMCPDICVSLCASAIGFARAVKCGSHIHNPTRAGFLGRHGAAEAGALWLVNGWV